MEKRDYYETLGVSKSASQDEIKSAYRKLALKYHPDRNPDNKAAEDKFKEAAQAYETLSSPEKRQRYDQFGHAAEQQGMGSGGGTSGFENVNMDDIFSSFGDIFGDLFGGKTTTSRRKKNSGPEEIRGHDLYKEITINLKESYIGTKQEIRYYHFAACETCNGLGARAGTKAQQCTQCHGTGQVNQRQGFFMYTQTCHTCGGAGYIIPSPCPTCSGHSRVQKLDKFSITIPHGIFDGAELRVSGKGDAGMFGGQSGDLFIRIKVDVDQTFKRVGDDLECTVMLTYPQLVFGAHIEIDNIDGTKVAVKIPKGCPVDEPIIITGKGFVKRKGSGSGNLVIIPHCHIPKKIDTESKELLSEYAKRIGSDIKNSNDSIIGFFKKFIG
jgi:molecular chaperone DnaJ